MTACRALTAGTSPKAEAVRLWIGGDVFVSSPAVDRLSALSETLSGAGIVNLEGPVVRGAPAEALVSGDRVTLVQSPSVLEELHEGGVVAVGVANNHRFDAGEEGLEQTRRLLEENRLLAIDERAVILQVDGSNLRIALTEHVIADRVPKNLLEELRGAAARADVLVATFHTATDERGAPSQALLEAVAIAQRSGASVVAVTGSHDLGPVMRQGPTAVAFGLGNLLFDCSCTDRVDAIALEVEIFPDKTASAMVIPVSAGLSGAAARRAPDPERIFDRLEVLGSDLLIRGEGGALF